MEKKTKHALQLSVKRRKLPFAITWVNLEKSLAKYNKPSIGRQISIGSPHV